MNPLFAPSPLPYRLPPFADIREEHYLPAFERGMAEHLAEVEAVACNAEPPTFENTLVALERSGALLHRVENAFSARSNAHTNPALQAVDAETSPRLAAHNDAIYLNRALYERVEALHETRGKLDLDDESFRLLDRYRSRFLRAGAQLSQADQQRLRELNTQLATAATAFEQNLFADTRAAALVVDTAEELAGLSADAVASAAENGKALGHDGKYVISLQSFSNQSELAVLEDRGVRRRLLEASLARGLKSNRELVVRMAQLRAERAALLGYENHAAYQVADQTAGSTEAVAGMLGRLVPPAVANAEREAAALAAAIGDGELAAWDWKYYSEKVRKARYDIDGAAMRPYFELDRVLRDGVFFAAGQVYGLSFTERPDLAGYHPDVRVFEVFEEDGTPLGLFLGDFYARESKRGGAWMDAIVPQCDLLGQRPVVINNLNIAKPPSGEPTLLTFDEVTTMFHEFGHALHGLFSEVRYPFLSMEVPRDFVEYPSQVNEMWSVWPEVLANYARHHETGEPMPAELVERMLEAAKFGEGFRTVEYLGAALLDWAWHTLPADREPGDAESFEAAALQEAGVALPAIPPRYRSTYFQHIFAGGHYAAGYYSYIWSEVLDADTVEWFKENGGMLRSNGDIFRRELLSRGGSIEAMAAYRNFRGRDPQIQPLLVRRGLAD